MYESNCVPQGRLLTFTNPGGKESYFVFGKHWKYFVVQYGGSFYSYSTSKGWVRLDFLSRGYDWEEVSKAEIWERVEMLKQGIF